MATWLHDPSALESLARGPGGAAHSWANLRLALQVPERMAELPSRPEDLRLALAIGARGALDGILARIRERGGGALDALDDALALGWMPEDRAPWREAARALFPSVPERDRAAAARALADLGGLDGEILSAAARSEGPDGPTLIPALVLRWAEGRGLPLDPVAAEVAGPLARAEASRPGTLGWTMTALGLPHLAPGLGLERAIAVGAGLAGAPTPRLGPVRGSVRSRARRWILERLEGRAGPAEALLRALCAHEGPDPGELCALAAWCAARPDPADPTTAILRGAGEDRALLSQAGRAMDSGSASALIGPLEDPALLSSPLIGLGARWARGARELGDALVVRAVLSRDSDIGAEVGLHAAGAAAPERVPGWIAEPETRILGLSCARYVPTVEVLEALLALPAPLEPEARTLYCQALAELADPAALSALEAVDGIPGEVLACARELLGRQAC